jgi:hypothetical protein
VGMVRRFVLVIRYVVPWDGGELGLILGITDFDDFEFDFWHDGSYSHTHSQHIHSSYPIPRTRIIHYQS